MHFATAARVVRIARPRRLWTRWTTTFTTTDHGAADPAQEDHDMTISTTSLRRRVATGGLLLSLAVLALPTGTLARDGDIIRRGDCTGATDWKIKLSAEDGRIEAEAEIDQNRNGRTWNWSFKNDGVRFARGTATTRAPSGSFEVRRLTSNGSGPDRIVFRAVNPATGEVCRAVATF